jgi:hypothetical protein
VTRRPSGHHLVAGFVDCGAHRGAVDLAGHREGAAGQIDRDVRDAGDGLDLLADRGDAVLAGLPTTVNVFVVLMRMISRYGLGVSGPLYRYPPGVLQ